MSLDQLRWFAQKESASEMQLHYCNSVSERNVSSS